MPSRTTTAGVVGLVALAAVLSVVAGVVIAGDGAGASTANQTIVVSGTDTVEASPDAAVVSLSVRAEGADAGAVGQEVANGAADLRSALADFGIAEENIQTQGYQIHQRERPQNGGQETVYVGEQTVEVTLDDVDRVGPLIDAAVAGGADTVGGVRFTLSEDRREELRDEAIRGAIDNARGEATVIANSTELQLGGVQRAVSGQTGFQPYRAELSAGGADAGTEIEPRDVTVSATVEVTFAASAA